MAGSEAVREVVIGIPVVRLRIDQRGPLLKELSTRRNPGYLPRTHTRPLVAGIREALDTCDFEQGLLLNLYKVAHYETAVDKWDNFSRAI